MAVTFDTVFKIGAVFTGAAAMNQAQAAVTKLEQKGLLAGLSLKKMVVAIGGLTAGYLTVDKLTGFLNSSVDAARRAKAAYQGIGDALGKVPALQKLGSAAIDAQKLKLKQLAEQMEKTGVIASESLAGAFSKLAESGMSPARIHQISGAFEDLVVRVKGVKASADDVVAVADQVGTAIKAGGKEGADALIQLGIITEDQRQKFESLGNGNRRYNMVLGEMQKQVGNTAEAMKTWDGVQQRFQNAWKDIKVALGTPFMEAQDKITAKMAQVQEKLTQNADKIANVITPIISKYADKAGDFFVKLIDNLDKYGPQLDKFLGVIDKVFGWFIQHGKEVSAGVAAITGSLAVFGGAAQVAGHITAISKAVTGLSEAWKVLSTLNVGAIIGLMTNPATWIVIGIVAVAAAIYLLITHWEDVKKACIAAWNAVQVAWGNAGKWFQDTITEPAKRGFDNMWNTVSKSAADCWAEIQKTWNAAINWFDEQIIMPILDLWGALPADVKDAIGDIAKVFVGWAGDAAKWVNANIIQPIVDLFKGLPDLLMKALGNLVDTVMKPFLALGQKLQEWWSGITNFFTGGAGGAGGGVAAVGPAAGGASSPAAMAALQTAGQYAGGSTVWGKSTLSQLPPSISGGITAGENVGGAMPTTGVTSGPLKALSFGPVSGDKGHAANYSAGGSGPRDASGKHLLMPNDIAVSQEMLGKFPMGSYVSIVKNGKVLYSHQKVADTSWFNNPIRPTHTFEQRHVEDLGTAELVREAQFGGLFSHPALTSIAERVPEMVVPLEGTSRSRSLLGAAAERIGMGGMMRGGGGATHLSMNAPITIHGVQAGQEGAIAREVQKALQDPIRNLLDQLKKAKQHEQRLSYA